MYTAIDQYFNILKTNLIAAYLKKGLTAQEAVRHTNEYLSPKKDNIQKYIDELENIFTDIKNKTKEV